MKRLLLPLLAAIALPNAVIANVDSEVHKLCLPAADYLGCVKAMTTKPADIPSLKLIEGKDIMNYPYVLKPRNEGSSVGVGIIKNDDDKEKYIDLNKERDEILIQEFIDGKEIQVAIYGDNKTGSIEIDPKNEFYDYESKYFDNGETKHIIPPRITEDQIVFVENLALKAHNALGCKGISRTDFILEKDSGIFYILEVNTQPGMTPTSLVPEIAKSKGTDFDELINWIIDDASTNR